MNQLYQYTIQYLSIKQQSNQPNQLCDLYVYDIYCNNKFELLVAPPYSKSTLINLLKVENKEISHTTSDVSSECIHHLFSTLQDKLNTDKHINYSINLIYISSLLGNTTFCDNVYIFYAALCQFIIHDRIRLNQLQLHYTWLGDHIIELDVHQYIQQANDRVQSISNELIDTDVIFQAHTSTTLYDIIDTNTLIEFNQPSNTGILHLQLSSEVSIPIMIRLTPVTKQMISSHNVDVCSCCDVPLQQPSPYNVNHKYNRSDVIALCKHDKQIQQLHKNDVINAIQAGKMTYIKPMYADDSDSRYDSDVCYTCGM